MAKAKHFKRKLVEDIAHLLDMKREHCHIIVNAVLMAIANGLSRGEDVKVAGLGTFTLRHRRAYTIGKAFITNKPNVQTDEPTLIPATNYVHFEPSTIITASLNRDCPSSRERQVLHHIHDN